MTKPANRQEMAEWTAEKVLGFCLMCSTPDGEGSMVWVDFRAVGDFDIYGLPSELERFIYSPDGFFAVKRAYKPKTLVFHDVSDCKIIDGNTRCIVFNSHDIWVAEALGDDEFDAFYSAVFEAMNK